MNFLINCSNLKVGGGVQVADSICGLLYKYPQHKFWVVLSPYMEQTQKRIVGFSNVTATVYEIQNTISTIMFGKDNYLDRIVEVNHIDAVLTVFGPSRWTPNVPHLSGFALPHLVIPESPFFRRLELKDRVKYLVKGKMRKWNLYRSSRYFWTENPYISQRLASLFSATLTEVGGGADLI